MSNEKAGPAKARLFQSGYGDVNLERGSVTADEIDYQEDREGNSEEPKQGIACFSALVDCSFNEFHITLRIARYEFTARVDVIS
jgi:hypothetical protein